MPSLREARKIDLQADPLLLALKYIICSSATILLGDANSYIIDIGLEYEYNRLFFNYYLVVI